jgi:hypothetical protein
MPAALCFHLLQMHGRPAVQLVRLLDARSIGRASCQRSYWFVFFSGWLLGTWATFITRACALTLCAKHGLAQPRVASRVSQVLDVLIACPLLPE